MLSTMQRQFVDLYAENGGNGAEAAKKVGYRRPAETAARLLSMPEIQLALAGAVRDAFWRAGLTPKALAGRGLALLDSEKLDGKAALELMRLLGRWGGFEDGGDRRLLHEALRRTDGDSGALPLNVPRPAAGAWDAARA